MTCTKEDVRDATQKSREDVPTESTEAVDFDSDSAENAEQDYDSGSDYGKPRKSKGKRMRGRQKTKSVEEARIVAALEARRKRKRLNHITPDSGEKDPKRHLFGPLGEWRDLSETASPTPSKAGRAANDTKEVNAATSSSSSSHSPASRRATRAKHAMQAENIPGRQPFQRRPSMHDSASPASRHGLIAKLKIGRPSVTTEKVPPETPGVDMRGKRKATRTRATMSQGETGAEEAADQKARTVEPHEQERQMRSSTRVTRQRPDGLAAIKAHSDAPKTPQLDKGRTTRHRQGAVASAIQLPEARQDAPTSTSEDDNPLDLPRTCSKPLPLSPHTSTPVAEPSNTLHVESTPGFAPYPPMSPRSLSPFTRGARIALENILADHQSDPLVDLIDLVEELDDTRPIVNDWEHVTVMKGGSWIYQVMRDVWEEAAGEVDDNDDEVREEDIDIEDVLEKVGEWVGKEMKRLGDGQE
ncbi:hypothetical protein G6011_04856 [Alternaria panax]|uniref:Uncharacterized protein n=1 Tax=Alternaria panax TaxID=48097 RepID=A0AAD4II48_9PLEO|nr:hypothetical protein G6011_04856 [Alternaria panax]